MSLTHTFYNVAAEKITFDMVCDFVCEAEAADLLTESLTLELKAKRDGNNVVDAVAAFYNTDGGIVLLGVAENNMEGVARIIGVPQKEHDRLVNQLNSLMPSTMPEIIPVRIPDTERIVIILRVNADMAPHPVVVAGKVLYRVPGSSVPADRQRILDLASRDSQLQQDSAIMMGPLNWLPRDFPLWDDPDVEGSYLPIATLRICGGLLLPSSILERPWLDTAARRAALAALNSSPLPAQIWESKVLDPALSGREAAMQLFQSEWKTIDAKAVSIKSVAPEQKTHLTRHGLPLKAASFLVLRGRELSQLVGLRWYPGGGSLIPHSLEEFYWGVLATCITISRTCQAVADALEVGTPTRSLVWEGWLATHDNHIPLVIDLSNFGKDGRRTQSNGWFPASKTPSHDIEVLDKLVRNWLTILLLENGVRDFEDYLTSFARPKWVE